MNWILTSSCVCGTDEFGGSGQQCKEGKGCLEDPLLVAQPPRASGFIAAMHHCGSNATHPL